MQTFDASSSSSFYGAAARPNANQQFQSTEGSYCILVALTIIHARGD